MPTSTPPSPARSAAALSDSPAGLAAWIGEKVVAWSSATRGRKSRRLTATCCSATLTLYWATGTITTSLLPVLGLPPQPRRRAAARTTPHRCPTAVSIFGGERVPFPKPPRELAERYYTIASWAEHPVGGHFPAVAEPELFVRSLRDAFRSAR